MEIQIRDPVHGFVCLREKEAKLLNTPIIQRLRGIKQLAMANLVYPGAVHTRFDHTLGVTHVAGQMAKALNLDEDAIELIRYAAMLHDIGHGPFSHVSENVLEQFANRGCLKPDQKKEKIHEIITAMLIKTNPEISKIISPNDCENISELLGNGHGEPIYRSIVSGPLDADKQDYLLRDSYFCGVKYGVFDLHQLHRSLVSFGEDYNHLLMLKPDGIHAAEQYILAKYYLTTNVYRHKVRLITDQMIVRAIILGIEKDEIEELRRLYSFDNSENFTENYIGWDDARFVDEFGKKAQYGRSKCYDILNRLTQRRLFKRIFQARLKEFTSRPREQLSKMAKPEMQQQRAILEKEIGKALKAESGQTIDEDFVILHVFDIKSVKEMSRNDESSILVAQREPIPFEDESSLFASINEGFREEFVEIYAPVEWDSRADRLNLLNKFQEPIRNIIEQSCGNAEEVSR